MAINQVSLSFYPPRWRQRLTQASRGRTAWGTPVQIAGAAPVEDPAGPVIGIDAIKKWLTDQGFVPADWGHGLILQRGRIESLFGPEQEIEVTVAEKGGEVASVYCRFTLPRRTPPPLDEWAAFVVALCHRFELRLPEGTARCGADEFLAAVDSDRNYQEFGKK